MQTCPADMVVIIEAAYRAFAAYGVGPQLDFAARVSASHAEHRLLKQILTQAPLRTLPLETIEAYFEYIDAAHYDGTFRADEVRYFLPRALELIARNETHWGAPWLREQLDRMLERGNARVTWPVQEISAVDCALAAATR